MLSWPLKWEGRREVMGEKERPVKPTGNTWVIVCLGRGERAQGSGVIYMEPRLKQHCHAYHRCIVKIHLYTANSTVGIETHKHAHTYTRTYIRLWHTIIHTYVHMYSLPEMNSPAFQIG